MSVCACPWVCRVENTSGPQSVALQALSHRVQVDHLELRQVTAAAARLLANHHLEGRRALVRRWERPRPGTVLSVMAIPTKRHHHGVKLER